VLLNQREKIANSSSATGTRIINTDAKKNDAIFKINIGCHFILIKEFLPGMLKQRKGHVVQIASMASFFAAPGLVDYCCTKIGALYLTEGISQSL
jgi:all-trans-retinol dehydrogenase (NAD+)